jgi:phage terminase small subunit
MKCPLLEGTAMDSPKNSPSWEFRWRIVVIYVGLIISALILVVVTFLTDFLKTPEGQIPPVVWLLLAGAFLIAIIATLSNLVKIFDAIQDNTTKLEVLSEALKKNQSTFAQINKITHLSEAAKAIVFHDSDRQFLIEAVLNKLEHQDIEGAYEIIDGLAHYQGYEELSEHLRTEVNKHRGATDHERIEQATAAIEKLFENCQWVIASTRIEKLISTYPDSEKAKALRQTLIEKKEERKKVLLNAWDDAVRRHATDRSLEILKELDLYLTPAEGLALQEAARDVFKDKLHNLGIQFSLAVSGEQWDKAIQVGQEIMRDFPNSRMSEEIRERMDVLKQKVGQQSG